MIRPATEDEIKKALRDIPGTGSGGMSAEGSLIRWELDKTPPDWAVMSNREKFLAYGFHSVTFIDFDKEAGAMFFRPCVEERVLKGVVNAHANPNRANIELKNYAVNTLRGGVIWMHGKDRPENYENILKAYPLDDYRVVFKGTKHTELLTGYEVEIYSYRDGYLSYKESYKESISA